MYNMIGSYGATSLNNFHTYHPTSNHHHLTAPERYWSSRGASVTASRDNSLSALAGGIHQNHFVTTATSKQLESTYQLSPPQQYPPLRRRSHRPRGCRGGRKNRKVKVSNVPTSGCPSPSSSYRRHPDEETLSCVYDVSSESSMSIPVAKGDLSPYQHVKINNPWNFGQQNYSNQASMSGPTTKKYTQMLPPPVPSALFDCHRSYEKSSTSGTIGLKMLPSFDSNEDDDDTVDSAEESFSMSPPSPPRMAFDGNNGKYSSIIPPPVLCSFDHMDSAKYFVPNINCEATADTAISSSRSRSGSDDSDIATTDSCNSIGPTMNRQEQHMSNKPMLDMHSLSSSQLSGTAQGGSLFMTSPRSFLFGVVAKAAVQYPVRRNQTTNDEALIISASTLGNRHPTDTTTNANNTPRNRFVW